TARGATAGDGPCGGNGAWARATGETRRSPPAAQSHKRRNWRRMAIPRAECPPERRSTRSGVEFNGSAGKSEAAGDVTEVTRSPDQADKLGCPGTDGFSPAHPFGSLATTNLA